MDSSPSERVYAFDESFLTIFNVKFFHRKSSPSPFEINHVKLFSLATVAGFLYALSFVMRIVKFFQGLHLELAEVSEVGALISVYLISFSRATTLLVYRHEMRRLLKNLEKLYPVTGDQQLNYHLHGYANTIILRNKVMRILASFGSVLYFTMPIVQSLFGYLFRGDQYVYRYPFISWHPFNDQTLYTFPIVYILQMVTSLSGVFFLLNEDLIFTTSVTYMCMHYWHLNKMLSQMDARFEDKSRQELKKLIMYHYVLEDLRNDVDAIFSISTFIGFTIMKASLCLFLFAIFHGIDIINMLPFTMSFLVLLIPAYLRCSNGTNLQDASGSLINSLYDHNWYEGKPRYRKMITIVMMRANVPVLLHASSANVISLEYFKEFCTQTYQIFMFLHNFSQ